MAPLLALALAKVAAGKLPLGRALQWDALAFLPHSTDTCWLQTITHTHIKICIHPCAPDPSPPSLWTASLTSGSVTSARIVAAGPDGCLLELDYFPCCIVVCLWCMCFCAEGFFLLFFFSSPSSCYAVFFLPLSTYISLLIIPCMIVYVTNNKEPWTSNLEGVLVRPAGGAGLANLHLISSCSHLRRTEQIVSFSVRLSISENKYKWTSEGLLKDLHVVLKVTEMHQLSCNSQMSRHEKISEYPSKYSQRVSSNE